MPTPAPAPAPSWRDRVRREAGPAPQPSPTPPAPEPTPAARGPEWASALTGAAGTLGSFIPRFDVSGRTADLIAQTGGGLVGLGIERLVRRQGQEATPSVNADEAGLASLAAGPVAGPIIGRLTGEREPEDPSQVTIDPQAFIADRNQALLLENADELNARVESLGDQTYEEALGAERARRAQLQREAPESSAAGYLTGIAEQTAVPSAGQLGAARGVGRLGQAALNVGEGGLASFMAGYGASEEGGTEALREGAETGGLGAGVAAGAEAIAATVPYVGPAVRALRQRAADLRVAQSGVRSAAGMRDIARYPGTERAAQVLENSGATGTFGMASEGAVARRMEQRFNPPDQPPVAGPQGAAQRLRRLEEDLHAAGVTVDVNPLADEIERYADEVGQSISGRDVAAQLRETAALYRGQANVPYRTARAELDRLDELRNFSQEASARLGVNRQHMPSNVPNPEHWPVRLRGKVRAALRRTMDEAATSMRGLGGPEGIGAPAAQAELAARAQRAPDDRLIAGVAGRVAKESEQRRLADARNRWIGLTSSIAGSAGAGALTGYLTDDPVLGFAVGAGLNRVWRAREPGVRAGLYQGLARLLESPGSPFFQRLRTAAQRGPVAVAVEDYLLQRQSPEYRQERRDADSEENEP